jgi:DNA-binding CsgD family transcriptional regulator
MGVDDTLLRLLELSFRSPGDEEASSHFLDALSDAISPDARAVVLVEDPAPATLLFGGKQSRMMAGHLPRREGPGERIEEMPLGRVFDLPRLPGPIANHPVVKGLIEPTGLLPGPGLGIVTSAQESLATSLLLVLPRTEEWKPSENDRELMERLAPFVVQSVRLNFRLLGSGALTTLLDHLVLGVVLSDERGRVTYVNESAAEMLGVEPGESAPSGGEGLDPRSEALYRTVRPIDDGESLYAHPVDGRPLHMLSTAVDWPSWRGYAGRRYARALFIGDPKRGTSDPLGDLGQAYGLTTQEARLAALLVGDYTLAQAAEQLGITQNTARTVLKRVLAKTGTRRQASLVRLLLAGPAQIRPGKPGPSVAFGRRSRR